MGGLFPQIILNDHLHVQHLERLLMDATCTIMFVDDDALILDGIRRSLRRYIDTGVCPSFFLDGKSALEAIEECQPEFLVTDL